MRNANVFRIGGSLILEEKLKKLEERIAILEERIEEKSSEITSVNIATVMKNQYPKIVPNKKNTIAAWGSPTVSME